MINTLFANDALWFTVPALAGTFFFLVRLAMALTGIEFEGADGGGGDGIDFGDDIPGDTGMDEGMDHAETTSVFKFISIQTVTAFFMGFGWGGLVAKYPLGLDAVPSVVVALASGAGFVWLVIWLFKLMYLMESSGNISIKEAYDAEGVTTSTVPGANAGTGRVRLTIGDRQRAYGARTEGDEIGMGTRVRVVGVNRDNTVTVQRS